jgi:hypothetical protein
MALDPELNFADSESPEVWAPIHAWRTLGQLRAQAAIEPLLSLFSMFEDEGGSDWVSDELPQVYAMVGAAAIPALSAYLLDDSHDLYPRAYAASSLSHIAEAHPDFRAECIAPIVAVLEKFATNEPLLNSEMINYLMDLKALETLPLMEKAFAADAVDLMMQGDWEDVQIDMGVKEKRDTERPSLFPAGFAPLEVVKALGELQKIEFQIAQERQHQKKAEAKDKAKRKQAAKSRKINRKKRK